MVALGCSRLSGFADRSTVDIRNGRGAAARRFFVAVRMRQRRQLAPRELLLRAFHLFPTFPLCGSAPWSRVGTHLPWTAQLPRESESNAISVAGRNALADKHMVMTFGTIG